MVAGTVEKGPSNERQEVEEESGRVRHESIDEEGIPARGREEGKDVLNHTAILWVKSDNQKSMQSFLVWQINTVLNLVSINCWRSEP